jgi:hypothetical protein
MSGQSVQHYLSLQDSFERNMMIMIAQRWLDIQKTLDLNRATMIANAVSKMLGGK